MPKNKTRLELTWIGKDQRPRLEPRILLEDPQKSYNVEKFVGSTGILTGQYRGRLGNRKSPATITDLILHCPGKDSKRHVATSPVSESCQKP